MIGDGKIVLYASIRANTKILRELGEGGDAVAFMVEYMGDLACLKIGKRGWRQVESFMEEARIMEKADGAGGVPKLLLVGSDKPGLLITYCPHPTLYDLTQKKRLVSRRQCVQIFWAVAKALGDLHNAGIIHNDFKDDNIMVDVSGSEPCAYIIDLGLSCSTGQAPKVFRNKNPETHKFFPFYDFGLWCGGIAMPHCDTYTLGFIMKNITEYLSSSGVFAVDDEIVRIYESMLNTDTGARPSLCQVMESLKEYLLNTKPSLPIAP